MCSLIPFRVSRSAAFVNAKVNRHWSSQFSLTFHNILWCAISRCIDFLYYYPNQYVPRSGSCGYKFCDGNITRYSVLEAYSDFNRTFGVNGSCEEDEADEEETGRVWSYWKHESQCIPGKSEFSIATKCRKKCVKDHREWYIYAYSWISYLLNLLDIPRYLQPQKKYERTNTFVDHIVLSGQVRTFSRPILLLRCFERGSLRYNTHFAVLDTQIIIPEIPRYIEESSASSFFILTKRTLDLSLFSQPPPIGTRRFVNF